MGFARGSEGVDAKLEVEMDKYRNIHAYGQAMEKTREERDLFWFEF